MPSNKEIKKIFHSGGGYATAGEITSAGFGNYLLKKLVIAGVVYKVKRGLYRWNEQDMPGNELAEACAIVPKGILCLYSAWHFHGLSTYVPHEHHLAIEKDTQVLLPDYPPIKLYRWQKKYLEIGMATFYEQGTIRIYDVEKSVCDAVKFRNKAGKDMMLEVLKNYVARPQRNLDKLLDYARSLRVKNIIKPYIESLL